MRVKSFVEPGWSYADYVSDEITVLTYPDGSMAFSHYCRIVDAGLNQIQLVVAPRFHPSHQARRDDQGRLQVQPSVLCPDCGLRGEIRDGAWVSAP